MPGIAESVGNWCLSTKTVVLSSSEVSLKELKMYICFFEGESMGRRFDDPADMGKAIADFLSKHPAKTVRTEKYV
jgi:hypothetical protein